MDVAPSLLRFLLAYNESFEEKIYEALMHIVRSRCLYDLRNPPILVFGGCPALETALGTGVCLDSELPCLVRRRLGIACPPDHHVGRDSRGLWGKPTAFGERGAEISEEKFPVSERLLAFLRWKGAAGPTYGLAQIVKIVETYVYFRRSRLLHPGDRNIVACQTDPLGEALELDFFHRSQLEDLVRLNIRGEQPLPKRMRDSERIETEPVPSTSKGLVALTSPAHQPQETRSVWVRSSDFLMAPREISMPPPPPALRYPSPSNIRAYMDPTPSQKLARAFAIAAARKSTSKPPTATVSPLAEGEVSRGEDEVTHEQMSG